MRKTASEKKIIDLLKDPTSRLNSLYYIINKEGEKVKFQMNWAQRALHDNFWYSNLVLKARQLGISTYVCLLFLDRCLFNHNCSAGIIAHTREDAQLLFKRIKFAYQSIPDPLKRKEVAASARELAFDNGSSLIVGTSLRGSTFQYLHISEFGKICAHFPDKAREIVTGSLNTIGQGQYTVIESTAEGREGHFYELCNRAQAMAENKDTLSAIDFRFHFFPWWRCPDYTLNEGTVIPKEIGEYFGNLALNGVDLSSEQKSWYYRKSLVQRDDMKREYPSTPSEAFESAIDGSYYARWISEARCEGRITNVPYDKQTCVATAWDIGVGDANSIVFFQTVGKEIHVIDYYENNGEGLAHYASVLKSKPYVYSSHYAPHDIEVREFTSGNSRKLIAAKLGIDFITVKSPHKEGLDEGIEAVRGILHRCWFDEKNCSRLIKCLENYKKEWNEDYQVYASRPVHNWASHGSDAFRYLAMSIKNYLESESYSIDDQESEKLYKKHHPRFE